MGIPHGEVCDTHLHFSHLDDLLLEQMSTNNVGSTLESKNDCGWKHHGMNII
jgi:hypothetical protein